MSFFCNPRIFGRYLFVRIPGNGRVLTVCEVEVFSDYSQTSKCSCFSFVLQKTCICSRKRSPRKFEKVVVPRAQAMIVGLTMIYHFIY